MITQRIAQLLSRGVSHHNVLALTFTNKAADEMRQRVTGLVPGHSVWVGTFHRFCSRLLRQHAALVGLGENFTIYDAADSLKMLRDAVGSQRLDLVHCTPDRIADQIRRAKNNLLAAEQYVPRAGDPVGAVTAVIYPQYQRQLLAANAVDFDDLLLHVVRLLQENPQLRTDLDRRYRYILVDEYQDTNLAQYVIVRALSNDFPNLCVTGDPDQSIYGWRGANLNNILNFERAFPSVHVVRLEQNHRSAGHIVRVADQLISHNLRRSHNCLFTDKPAGPRVRLVAYADQQEEARQIAASIAAAVAAGRRRPCDFAILYRVNTLSRSLELALAERHLAYQIVSGIEFYQRKEVKDVLAYLQLVNNPRDDVAFLRVINTPPRGIGQKTLRLLVDYAKSRGLPLLAAIRQQQLVPGLSSRARAPLARFLEVIDRARASAPSSVEQTTRQVLIESAYYHCLQSSPAEEDRERLDNVEELLSAARQYDQQCAGDGGLEGYLEQAALVNDTDCWKSAHEAVTLMTLHAAKGLEFPVVYIVAVEHGLVPHERSHQDDNQLEEERRLLFVGITRAREELQLSFAKRRALRGVATTTIPSPFLMELPSARHGVGQSGSSHSAPRAQGRQMPEIDVDFDLDEDAVWLEPAEPARPPRADAPRADVTAPLITAADLAGQDAVLATSTQPEDFQAGNLVRHPRDGLGKILSTSGVGAQRTGTVQFFTSADQRTFQLRLSPLRLVRNSRA